MTLRSALCMVALALWMALAPAVHGQSNELPLMPLPASARPGTGQLVITGQFRAEAGGSGARDDRVQAALERLPARITRQTGIPIVPPLNRDAPVTLRIVVERADHRAPQSLGDDESYHLVVQPGGAQLSATAPLGVLRGIETFLQLVQPGPAGFAVPAVEIDDRPRFPWRGLSLDVSRHFVPTDEILTTIDGLAAVKMNVLHWHLSDDQGFRIESRRFPKLHQLGSDGQFYTQAEVRRILLYARMRGVRIVPEFDMPGHATSWFAAYPQYASGPGPYEIVRRSGILTATMDPTREATYRFLDRFIGEMAQLFPDRYFHIGGDEVNPREWRSNARIQQFMRRQHLADTHALQAYFNRRLQKIVARHGKQMEGWDEILHPDLPRSIVIQSWRGQASLAEAARRGYQGLLSAGYYLDLMRPAAQHYAVDPLKGPTASLDGTERERILGGEAAMWEELATAENIDTKLWPRTAAIAERLWSPETVTDIASMYRRLEVTSRWLEWVGLRHRTAPVLMRQRLAGAQDAAPLHVLASVLEPIKGYERHKHNGYTSLTPYNRLVDAIPPESDAARAFRDHVEAYLAEREPNPVQGRLLADQLRQWRDNTTRLIPLLEGNSLLEEDKPLARNLSDLCSWGLAALDRLAGTAHGPADWNAVLAQMDAAQAPQAELLIQIAPAMRRLVEAAANQHAPATK